MNRLLDMKQNDPELADKLTEIYMVVKGSIDKQPRLCLTKSLSDYISIPTFLANRRLVRFVEVFQNIRASRAKTMKKRKKLLMSRLDKTQNFKTLHAKMHEKMTSLQSFTMKTSSNIADIKSQIASSRESQLQKQSLI